MIKNEKNFEYLEVPQYMEEAIKNSKPLRQALKQQHPNAYLLLGITAYIKNDEFIARRYIEKSADLGCETANEIVEGNMSILDEAIEIVAEKGEDYYKILEKEEPPTSLLGWIVLGVFTIGAFFGIWASVKD